jgi:hypothetical protein
MRSFQLQTWKPQRFEILTSKKYLNGSESRQNREYFEAANWTIKGTSAACLSGRGGTAGLTGSCVPTTDVPMTGACVNLVPFVR